MSFTRAEESAYVESVDCHDSLDKYPGRRQTYESGRIGIYELFFEMNEEQLSKRFLGKALSKLYFTTRMIRIDRLE